jgi:hypothetical protein
MPQPGVDYNPAEQICPAQHKILVGDLGSFSRSTVVSVRFSGEMGFFTRRLQYQQKLSYATRLAAYHETAEENRVPEPELCSDEATVRHAS